MATKYLGSPVDIHGGGMDLCFPHHECEIAQVKPLREGEPYVRYWMHTAMVRYQGEKMSKSLGNLVMVSDLLKTYSPDALRLYLGSHHYREAWSYEEKDLQAAQALAETLREAALAARGGAAGGQRASLSPARYIAEFREAMENDLQTPRAVQALAGLAQGILEAVREQDVQEAQEALRKYGRVFGLTLGANGPEERVIKGWEAKKR